MFASVDYNNHKLYQLKKEASLHRGIILQHWYYRSV